MSMNIERIEALVVKHCNDLFNPDVTGAQVIRNALTEQAETHAIEMRAYEATVANLTRERDEAIVPAGYSLVPVELLQLIQCDVENAADWLSSAASALRNLPTDPQPKESGHE